MNPAGPPDIKQVFVTERVTGATDLALTYGTHPDVNGGKTNMVTTGVVTFGQQTMRIVVDELLDGKTVEQFECACTTNCDPAHAYSLDPFDCSICGDDPTTSGKENGKCLDNAGSISDGLPDVSTLQAGIANISCNSATAFTYDTGINDGWYEPSGNQLIPFGEGVNGLGPALELTPQTFLPTDADCTITINSKVKDKDGNPVPASEKPTFHTEPLGLVGSTAPADGDSGVDTATAISVPFNTLVDISGLTFTVSDGTNTVAGTPTINTDMVTVVFTPTAALKSATTYTVTVSGVKDMWGGALATPITFSFTTK